MGGSPAGQKPRPSCGAVQLASLLAVGVIPSRLPRSPRRPLLLQPPASPMSAAAPRKSAGGKATTTAGPARNASTAPAASSSSSSPSSTAGGGGPALSSLDWSGPVAPALLSCSSPSLSGEMLRLSLCEYLRTQVCVVQLVVVLYGFNSHEYEEDDDVPIKRGKLCYAAVTQSELVLLDCTQIGFVRKHTTTTAETAE